MITTAVQQASKMVEIQGAPAAVPANGKDFRVTFVASVSDPAATAIGRYLGEQGGGSKPVAAALSFSKQTLLEGAVAKSSSPTVSGGMQRLSQLADASGDKDAVETATDFSSNSEIIANAAVKNAAVVVPVSGDELRPAVLTPVSDGTPVKTPELATAKAARAADTVIEPGALASAEKADGLSKGAKDVVESGSKNAAPGSNTKVRPAKAEVVTTKAPATDHAVTAAAIWISPQTQMSAGPAVALRQTPDADDGAIAPRESKPKVLCGVLQAGAQTASEFSGSITTGVAKGSVAASASLTEVASLQREAVASPAAEGAGHAASVSQRLNAGSKGGEMVSAASKLSDEKDAVATRSAPWVGTPSSAAPASIETPLPKVSAAKSILALNSTEVKVKLPSDGLVGTAASQSRAVGTPHLELTVQPLEGFQAFASKSDGVEQSSLVKKAMEAPAMGVLLSAQSGTTVALQPDLPPEAASLRDASAKIAGAAVKDDKAKTVVAASQDMAGSGSTAAQTVVANIQAAPSNDPAASTAGAGGRVVTVADAAVAVSQAVPHLASSSAHVVAGDTGPAAARVLGSVSAGPFTESTAASVQVGESHRTLLATPTTLEVGVQSGTQGWLRIRAEVGDQGAVNASLAAGSSGGRELLHSQMPALNAFLHNEQMTVTTTIVDRGTLAGGSHVASGPDGLSGQDRSASHGSLLQGGGTQSGGARQDSSQQSMSGSASAPVKSHVVSGAERLSSGRTILSEESGRWLNVRV